MGRKGKTNPTVVVSIRIPEALAPKVDERAKREKKARSRFVEDVFEAAFRKLGDVSCRVNTTAQPRLK